MHHCQHYRRRRPTDTDADRFIHILTTTDRRWVAGQQDKGEEGEEEEEGRTGGEVHWLTDWRSRHSWWWCNRGGGGADTSAAEDD